MTSYRLPLWVVATVLTGGPLWLLDEARAESLYRRQDKSGTISFSNVPTESGYDRPVGAERPPATKQPAATSGLGKNFPEQRPAGPAPVPQTRDFLTVVGGGEHTGGSVLGIKRDGTVWQWGRTLGPVSRPACEHPIPNLVGVQAVDVGGTHGVALLQDGTVWSWGMNNNRELGDGRPAGDQPAPVAGLDQVAALAAGGAHTLARRRDGTVWAWGQNIFGQLGDGTRTNMGPPPHGRGNPAPSRASAT